LLLTLVFSGLLLTAYLVARRTSWPRVSIAAGLPLGMLNFANIYFCLRVHQQFPDTPTLAAAAMNIGDTSAGALRGAGVLRGSASRTNMAGLALAVIAVLMLVPR